MSVIRPPQKAPQKPGPQLQTNNPNDFLFAPKFSNTLPDLPYTAKFLKYSKLADLSERFSEYMPPTLEMTQKRMNICDMDVGVYIETVDPVYYQSDNPDMEIAEKDQKLLEDESKESVLKSKRSAQHATVVPFMRRTEYISAEFNRFGTGADRQETKIGYNLLKKGNTEDIFYRDRDSQIAAIQKTFEDVKTPVTKHHSKPGVVAEAEFSVFPDFELWKYSFAQVIFDADPSYFNVPDELRQLCLKTSRLTICDETNNLVGLFCPPVETLQKILETMDGKKLDGDVLTYNLNREYNWDIKHKSSLNFQDDYVFHKSGDNYYYNELASTVNLKRKRMMGGEKKRNITLEATVREFNQDELEQFEKKNKELLHPYDKEEEEEEEQDEEEKMEMNEKKENESDAEKESDDSPRSERSYRSTDDSD